MPFTTVNVTSGSGRGNIEISVATSKKSQAVQKGSDEGKNGTQSEGASERVMGVEKRFVSIKAPLLRISFPRRCENPAPFVAATRWTRQPSSGATSTSSRKCSTTSPRRSTRGSSAPPSSGRCGSSAKAGLETITQCGQYRRPDTHQCAHW